MSQVQAHLYATTSGGPVHWKDYGGTGPTLLLVHGLGGSAITWDAVGPGLTRFGRTLALDLPGFGLSPPAGDWTLESLARAVIDFTDDLAAPVTLIGNSLGGLISIMIASDRPDLVERLVLVSPATPPRLPDPRLHWPTAVRLAVQASPLLGMAMARHYRHHYPPEQLLRLAIDNIVHRPSRIPPDVMRDLTALMEVRYQLPWATDSVPKVARGIAMAWAKPASYVARIRKITAPTLVVQGLEDRIVSPTAVEWLVSLRLDWELIQMEDTGHTPQLDAPVRFVEAITPWLDKH